MKQMKSCIFLALVTYCGAGHASTFPSKTAAKAFTDQVMAKVATGDIVGGLKLMKPYTVVPSAEFDSMIGQVSLQLPAIGQRFGRSVGVEFINEQKVGESVEELVYLGKFERTVMRWRFYLYKGPSGWTINSFKFDDQIQDLFTH